MLTAKQDNRLTAAENLLAALKKDPAPYARDPSLQRIVQELDAFVAALAPLRQQAQRSSSGGPGEEKTTARLHLATVAAEVAGDLFAYAAEQKLPRVQALADYHESQLANLRGSRLTDVATVLLDELPAHQPALSADYGLDAARTQELQAAIQAYATQKTAPRQAAVEGKTARTGLRAQFSSMSTLLKDRFARGLRKYKRANPAFYERVKSAREVVDRAGSQPKPVAAPGA